MLTGETGIAKLNAPNAAFVVSGTRSGCRRWKPGFDAIQSFALGGLGNAWGAGLYRFVDADLAGFPSARPSSTPTSTCLTARSASAARTTT